jgi:hypothetical protein
MFLTRNKKDYTRHLKSRKHLENHPSEADTTTPTKTQQCAKCNKEFKSRTSVYSHIKKCGTDAAAEAAATPDPASLTPDQIQYILMENKILKELLKNVIQGHHPPHSV